MSRDGITIFTEQLTSMSGRLGCFYTMGQGRICGCHVIHLVPSGAPLPHCYSEQTRTADLAQEGDDH